MKSSNNNTFGNSFERILVTIISIATGIILIYLAIEGPLFLQHIRYKTADIINNQFVGQDIVIMFVLSVYLLWVRPKTTYPVQFMFYGFFLTMFIAVNAMGITMFLNNDPTFLMRDLVVFLVLALIVFTGFIYILKNYKSTPAST